MYVHMLHICTYAYTFHSTTHSVYLCLCTIGVMDVAICLQRCIWEVLFLVSSFLAYRPHALLIRMVALHLCTCSTAVQQYLISLLLHQVSDCSTGMQPLEFETNRYHFQPGKGSIEPTTHQHLYCIVATHMCVRTYCMYACTYVRRMYLCNVHTVCTYACTCMGYEIFVVSMYCIRMYIRTYVRTYIHA